MVRSILRSHRTWFGSIVVAAVVGLAGTENARASLTEDFENAGSTPSGQHGPSGLLSKGWVFRNQSTPASAGDWTRTAWAFQGSWGLNIDQSVGFWNGPSAEVSSWAILPPVPSQAARDVIRFFRSSTPVSGLTATARLQIRYSPTGGTNTGSSASDVGDFSVLLKDILDLEVLEWTEDQTVIPGGGRIAMRFYIAPAAQQPDFWGSFDIDNLSVGPADSNPPIPNPGETVHWTTAMSPIDFSESATIPQTGMLIVDPGVVVNVSNSATLKVEGTLQMAGSMTSPVQLNGPIFPPSIEILGGSVDAAFTEFRGQVLVSNGADIHFRDSLFTGNGVLRTKELFSAVPFLHIERCTFVATQMVLSDVFSRLEENVFDDTYALILRGYPDLTTHNQFTTQPLSVIRESTLQPLFIDGIEGRNVTTGGGLELEGGDYLVGSQTVLTNNLYPIEVRGGLLDGSVISTTGNVVNSIAVGSGGFQGSAHWSNLGLPYLVTEGGTSAGTITISPGVLVQMSDPTAWLNFVGGRLLAEGLPDAPIRFEALPSVASWFGIRFSVNSDRASRMEWCEVRDGNFGVNVSNSTTWIDHCSFIQNKTGLNCNTFSSAYVRGSLFFLNDVGVSMSTTGHPRLASVTNPNTIEFNTVGIDAFDSGSSTQADHVWWGSATGPSVASNPGGSGDSIVGTGKSGVTYQPFLTSPPLPPNPAPRVRIQEPGPHWSLSPSFFADPSTSMFLQWEVAGTNVVKQRIEFSPTGQSASNFSVIVDDLPGDQTTFHWSVPNPGFANPFGPQFVRVVATDASGQEGHDLLPLTITSDQISGSLSITTDLTGQTFFSGEEFPVVNWTHNLSGLPGFNPVIVLENDGSTMSGIYSSGAGHFFFDVPSISTDRARLAVRAHNNSNDIQWFFSAGYFSIRHDPRFGFTPPVVTMTSPLDGAMFVAGNSIPIEWNAQAVEGIHSFDILTSLDGGRTWRLVAEKLPSTATSFSWQLPPGEGVSDVRVRVVARDRRFQNSSDGDDRLLTILPGTFCQASVGFGGPGNSTLSVCGAPLASGNSASLLLTGTPANANVFLVASTSQNPTPFLGGSLVPIPVLVFQPFVATSGGNFSIPAIPGGGGPFDVYVQFIVADPAMPLGIGLSNGVKLEFLP